MAVQLELLLALVWGNDMHDADLPGFTREE